MQFNFDSKRYTVSIVTRPLILDGQPCRAKCDLAGLRILLSDQLPKHERRLNLFHELRHCWVHSRGPAAGVEADADDAALMMDAMMEQYLSQGGDAILEALIPDPVAAPRSNHSRWIERQCGFCKTLIAPGSMTNQPPEWNADAGMWIMDRAIDCDCCGKFTVWREGCTPAGLPLGEILEYPQPRILEGREAAAWRENHEAVCR